MPEVFANGAVSTLSSAINASVTTIPVTSAALMPATGNFRLLVDSEIILITAVSGNNLTATRGQEGTTAASHLINATAGVVTTAGAMAQIQADASWAVLVRPIDGTSDDWPTLMAIAAANAYGKPIMMLPGLAGQAWQCKSVVSTPSGATFYATPGTKIVCTLPTSSVADAAFTAGLVTTGATILLSADTVVGAKTISVASSVPVNSVITLSIASGQRGSAYTVTSVTGAGPYTLTLDRTLMLAYTVAGGSYIQQVSSRPQDIRVFGNGMVIAGTASCYLNFVGGYRCHVEDLIFDGSGPGALLVGSGIGALYDTYSVDCEFWGIRSNCVAANGIRLASCENCKIYDCSVSIAAAASILLTDCALCEVLHSYGTGSSAGVLLSSDGNALGCQSTKIVGGAYTNSGIGIDVISGTTSTLIMSVTCRGNSGAGISLQATTALSRDTHIENCDCTGNVTGISVNATVIGSTIVNCDVSDNSANGMVIAADTTIDGLKMRVSAASQTGVLINGGQVHLTGFTFESTAAATNCQFIQQAGGNSSIDKGVFTFGGTGSSYCLRISAGVCVVSNVKAAGVGLNNTIGLGCESGGTIRIGQGISMDGCVFPTYTAGGAGYLSIGSFTANGATPVVNAFPNIRTTDKIYVTRTGGTVTAGLAPGYVTRVANTSWSWNSTAGDAGVYDFRIDG